MTLWGTSDKSLKAVIICLLVSFFISFDLSVLVSSHSMIENYFDCSFTLILWLSVSIAVSLVIFSPLSIDIVDKYGKRNGAMLGLVIIAIGSILSFFSSELNIFVLVFSRMITGMGMSLMCTTSIITDNVNKKYLPEAMAVSFSVACIGSAISPIVGLYLSNMFGWQFVFLPLTILFIALIIVFRTIDNVVVDPNREINYVLHILFIVSIGLIINTVFFPKEEWYVYLSGWIVLLVFIYVQRKTKKHIIDLSIFKNNLFRMSIILSLLFLFSAHCIDDAIVLFMDKFRDDLQIIIGPIVITSTALAALLRGLKPTLQFFISPLAARLNRGKSPMRLTIVGFALLMVVPVLYVIQSATPDYGVMALILVSIYVFISFSTAIFRPQNKSIIMSCVESYQRNAAGTIISLVENLGRCLGSILNVLFFSYIAGGDEILTYSFTTAIVIVLAFISCGLGLYLAIKRKNDFI